MFAAKQAPSLRQRFRELKEGAKLGRVSERAFKGQAAEICMALRKLGEDVRPVQPTCRTNIYGSKQGWLNVH